MTRILFLVHGHPAINKGGGEIAAWNLFDRCRKEGMKALLLARTDTAAHPGTVFSVRSPDEILFHCGIHNLFDLSNPGAIHVHREIKKLVLEFKPDIIHVHHYYGIGVEIFRSLKQAAPFAKLIFTLHEYMGMCMHYGTMVRTNESELCYEASPADCHRCFPQHTSGDFFLRKQFILDQFSYIDHFIAPSNFLKSRYCEMGLAENKITVLENLLDLPDVLPPRTLGEGQARGKFGFFGQISPFKGVNVLLKAVKLMPKSVRKKVHIEIYGANLDRQSESFRNEYETLLRECHTTVSFKGRYESRQLPALMSEVDWVVVPSTWWENSPIVIQEALASGRPVIGSDIGGVREKIDEGGGLLFRAGNAGSLATVMEHAMNEQVYNACRERLKVKRDNFVLYQQLYAQMLERSICVMDGLDEK